MSLSRIKKYINHPFSAACLTWLMTSLFYSFQFFLRSSPNAMSDVLMHDFQINVEELGWFTAMYYIPYSLLQVPLGVSLDIWGPKRILRIGTIICVLGSALFAMAPTFNVALLGRMMIGIGAAASFIGSIRMSTLWFSPIYLAFSIGLLSAMGKLGGAMANKILPHWMSMGMSWKSVIWILCSIGGILTILIWLFLKNGPQDAFHGVSERPSVALIRKEIMYVLKTPTVWAMGLYGYSMYLVLSVFSDMYSINFLSCKLNISKEAAGSLSSWAPIGSAIGASLVSFLSDRFQQRQFFVRFCACATFILSTLIFFGPPVSFNIMRGLLLALGLSSSGQILIFPIVAESFSSRLTGIATGLTNALLMLGGALHNPLVGFLISMSVQHRLKNASELVNTSYTLIDYQWGFSSITLCFLAAVIIGFFVKETHPSQQSHIKKT